MAKQSQILRQKKIEKELKTKQKKEKTEQKRKKLKRKVGNYTLSVKVFQKLMKRTGKNTELKENKN